MNRVCNQTFLCGQVPSPLTPPGCVVLGTVQTELPPTPTRCQTGQD